MKILGKFKMQAHIISGVVMDSTAFKVSHCVGCDINATALPAARARSVSIAPMDADLAPTARRAVVASMFRRVVRQISITATYLRMLLLAMCVPAF